MKMHRKDFWFHNAKSCMEHCKKNNINPKHWKRSSEARMHKLGHLINMNNKFNDREEESRGDTPVHRECVDDVESETEDVMRKLKSFKRSAWWSDSDDDYVSSDDDESHESSSTKEITIIVHKKSKMKSVTNKR